MQSKFDSFDLQHVPKSGNAHADSLAMLATSSTQDLPRVILVEDLYKPSKTGEMVQINQIRAEPSRAELDGSHHTIPEEGYSA